MKKLNKFFAVLVALAMMATLAVTMAFAEGEDATTTTTVKQSTQLAKAALTKDFDVPAGVTVPNATFTFVFDNKAKPSSATKTLADQTISWDNAADKDGTKTGEQYKVLYLKDVFNYNDQAIIDTTKSVLTQPGEYVYVVTESHDTTKSYWTKVASPSVDNVDLSNATYTLRVYVVRDGENLKVSAITVEEGDTSTTVPDPTDRKKVNPDADKKDNGTPDDESDDYTASDFIYKNVYTKTVKVDPADKDGAFNIAKNVTGSGDTGVAFPFTATITLDENTTLADDKLVGKIGDTEVTFTFTNGKATQSFELKHGEKLVFSEFPAGATVAFEETLDTSTIQNKDLYTKATSGSAVTGKNFAAKENAKDTTIAINEKANVAVENKLDSKDIEPEGILISNLPYIVLALVAVGGLVAYVVVRRKADEEA